MYWVLTLFNTIQATRLLAFIIAPAYFCATASTFAFYLVTNIIQDWSSSDYDITVLIFWVIMNFFISSATLGLLILGMRGGDWYVSRLGSDTGKPLATCNGSQPDLISFSYRQTRG
jgi:hypothetical protein